MYLKSVGESSDLLPLQEYHSRQLILRALQEYQSKMFSVERFSRTKFPACGRDRRLLPGADHFFEKQQSRDDRPQVRQALSAPGTRLIQTCIYFTASVKLKRHALENARFERIS